jgi:hypothetical protein
MNIFVVGTSCAQSSIEIEDRCCGSDENEEKIEASRAPSEMSNDLPVRPSATRAALGRPRHAVHAESENYFCFGKSRESRSPGD